MAETEKGSDTKPGEPSGEQLPGSEPKKSSMKAPKEDGSTSGKKAKKKKKKKKTVEDTATHDNVGKIASEDASNKDASTGSTKKSKGASNKESNAGLAKKSKGLKKSSSKEGKSDGKAAAKKGLHPKADAEKLSGSEAKDAIKKKKTKKKKKKPVASQLPSSPVVLLQPSEPTPDAISQPYLAYPPGTAPFAAQPPINQAGAPEVSSGIISRLESFFGVGEQTDASQQPAAFTAAPQVTSQFQPAPFPAFQGPQMPFGAPQMMPGQPAPTGEQYALTAQQTHLMPVQPNLGQQEHAQPAFAQPTLDGRTLERQTTVDQGQGQPMLVQSMPVESMQGHIAPSHSLPSQPTGGQSSLTQPAPAEFTQGKLTSSRSLPNQITLTQHLPTDPTPTAPVASQHASGQTSVTGQPAPTQAATEQRVPLQPFPGQEVPGQTVGGVQMSVPHVSTEAAPSEMTLGKATTYAWPQHIPQLDTTRTAPLSGSQTSILTPSRRASVIFADSASLPGGPFVPTLRRQDIHTEESFYHSVPMADPEARQDRRPSLVLTRRLTSERPSIVQWPHSESPPSPSRFFTYGQTEIARPASRRPSRSSFFRRPSRTRHYSLPSYGSPTDATGDILHPLPDVQDVVEPADSWQDGSAYYRRRSSRRSLSESRSRAATGEDTHWQLGDYEPVSRGRRSSLWREESPEPHRRAASASRPYQPWETRCAADTTRHIKYTAAVAEDLRIASLALRRLRYDTETERRRRDFLATELMKRAALASSEVRRASMALAAMYPEPRSAPPHAVADQDSVYDADTASPEERLHRRRPKASAKEPEIPVRPAAGPGGEHKAQSVASAPSKSLHEHRMTSHLVRPHRPEQDSGHSSHPMHFSFEATSSGAAAMPAARKTTSKRSLARKSSRSSLAAVSESSTDEYSGCDMCGGLWRGLVREAPTVEESSSAQDEDVLEVGGQVTGPVKWPLSCPGSRKRSSVATVTALNAVRRGSRRRPSEKPKQEVPDEHVATVLLEERQMSPLECFPGISEALVASIAGKGDADVETIGDNTWNQMVLDAGADGHREMHGGHAELELGNPQLEDGYCIRGMEGMQLPVDEGDYNVEAEMWKFAESTVPMFPESGVAVLFLLACLVWMGVVMFAGGAHHNLSTTRSVTDRDRTGRSRPEDVESPLPSEPAVPWTAAPLPYTPGPPTTPGRPAASTWLVCESAQCMTEAHRLSTLLEGEPCRNFYDYACQRVDETPPLPTRGTASSADTRLADELEDSLLAYVRDPAHSDVAVARELLDACGTGTAQDLADFVAAYVRPTWPSSGVTNDLSVWEAAGRLLRELGVAALVSVEPVVKRTSAVALGPAQLLLRPGDDAAHKQLLSDAVRDTVAFVSPSADARTVAEDVVKVLSDLSRIQDTALTRRGPVDDTLPLSNLSAGPAALVRAASSSPRLAPSTVLLLHGVDLPSLSALVTARALPVLHYVGFRAALWVAPFVSTPPDKLIMAHMLTRQPPIADKQHACSRAVGHAVPLVYLRALRGALGPLILARMWTDQLEDRFLRSLPRLLPQPGPDAHLVARSVRDTPLARFYPARLADAKGWNTHLLALAASMANTTGQRKNTLLKVRMAAAAADRSGGWALDMRPTWLPGGALRLPPGLFGSILPLNSSLHTLQMARVAVRLYTALTALLRDIPGVFDSPVRESEQTNLRSVAECLRKDLNAMPTALKSGFPPAKGQPWALFDQAVGLALAHDNLAEMLDTRRIWGKDLRLKGLEHLSSDQLFFVYYALDNCQRSDAQAQRRLSWPLGGQERVNGPLRHWAPFAEHFGCLHGQPMVAAKRCTLLADA